MDTVASQLVTPYVHRKFGLVTKLSHYGYIGYC